MIRKLFFTVGFFCALSCGAHPALAQSPDAEIEQRAASKFEADVARSLVNQLHDSFPDLLRLLTADPAVADQEGAYRTALDLAGRARGAQGERRAVLLLAADRVATKIWFPIEHAQEPEVKQKMENLRAHGLTLRGAGLGGVWVYSGDLLRDIWREFPATSWGEDAFVFLLASGWDTSPTCEAGADRFREVIRQGEKFLTDRPASPRRPQVLFYVAEAYETWWSLSQAVPCTGNQTADCDDYANPGDYQQGSAEARQKAIEAYEQLAQFAPQSDEAAYAQRHLPLLKQGEDTNQRRFFCIYD